LLALNFDFILLFEYSHNQVHLALSFRVFRLFRVKFFHPSVSRLYQQIIDRGGIQFAASHTSKRWLSNNISQILWQSL